MADWIPLSERAPSEPGYYLGYFPDDPVFSVMPVTFQKSGTGTPYFRDMADGHSFTIGGRRVLKLASKYDMTHWMPLPEPPTVPVSLVRRKQSVEEFKATLKAKGIGGRMAEYAIEAFTSATEDRE